MERLELPGSPFNREWIVSCKVGLTQMCQNEWVATGWGYGLVFPPHYNIPVIYP